MNTEEVVDAADPSPVTSEDAAAPRSETLEPAESADGAPPAETQAASTATKSGPGPAAGESPDRPARDEADATPSDSDSREGKPVQRAEFPPLSPGKTSRAGDNMALLMDVTVPVTIELGGTILPLREILALGPGSVVKLDRPLGEPVDILVNGELVGRGEVVVVEDQFGVQVTELLDPDTEEKK